MPFNYGLCFALIRGGDKESLQRTYLEVYLKTEGWICWEEDVPDRWQNCLPSSFVLQCTVGILMPAAESTEPEDQRSCLLVLLLSPAAKDQVLCVFLCVGLPFPFGERLHRAWSLQPCLMYGGVRRVEESDQTSRLVDA